MATKLEIDRLAYLAMRFYYEAEAPSEGTMFALFHLLAERNEPALVELLQKNGVEPNLPKKG